MVCERIVYGLSCIDKQLRKSKDHIFKIMSGNIEDNLDAKFELKKMKIEYQRFSEQIKTVTSDIESLQMAYKFDYEVVCSTLKTRKLLKLFNNKKVSQKEQEFNIMHIDCKYCKNFKDYKKNNQACLIDMTKDTSTRANVSTEFYASEYVANKSSHNSPIKTKKTVTAKKRNCGKNTHNANKTISQAAMNYLPLKHDQFENARFFGLSLNSISHNNKTLSENLMFKEIFKEDIPEFEEG